MLGDIGGVVRNPFLAIEIVSKACTPTRERVQNGPGKAGEGFAVNAVDFVGGFEHMLGKFGVPSTSARNASRTMARTPGRHRADIDGKFGGGQLDHVHDSLCDVDRLVANPLEIGIDFDDGQNEPLIDRTSN